MSENVVKYRFSCTCGFIFESSDRDEVLGAAQKHTKTCNDVRGADDIALEAMIEIIEE